MIHPKKLISRLFKLLFTLAAAQTYMCMSKFSIYVALLVQLLVMTVLNCIASYPNGTERCKIL